MPRLATVALALSFASILGCTTEPMPACVLYEEGETRACLEACVLPTCPDGLYARCTVDGENRGVACDEDNNPFCHDPGADLRCLALE